MTRDVSASPIRQQPIEQNYRLLGYDPNSAAIRVRDPGLTAGSPRRLIAGLQSLKHPFS